MRSVREKRWLAVEGSCTVQYELGCDIIYAMTRMRGRGDDKRGAGAAWCCTRAKFLDWGLLVCGHGYSTVLQSCCTPYCSVLYLL